MTESDFPHYLICFECATEKGGTWPDGRVATLSMCVCEYCNGEKQKNEFIAPYVDYDWPDFQTSHLRD